MTPADPGVRGRRACQRRASAGLVSARGPASRTEGRLHGPVPQAPGRGGGQRGQAGRSRASGTVAHSGPPPRLSLPSAPCPAAAVTSSHRPSLSGRLSPPQLCGSEAWGGAPGRAARGPHSSGHHRGLGSGPRRADSRDSPDCRSDSMRTVVFSVALIPCHVGGRSRAPGTDVWAPSGPLSCCHARRDAGSLERRRGLHAPGSSCPCRPHGQVGAADPLQWRGRRAPPETSAAAPGQSARCRHTGCRGLCGRVCGTPSSRGPCGKGGALMGSRELVHRGLLASLPGKAARLAGLVRCRAAGVRGLAVGARGLATAGLNPTAAQPLCQDGGEQ